MLKKFDTVPEIELFLNPLINGDFSGDDILVLGDYVKKLKSGDFYLEIGTKYGKSLASAIFQASEGVKADIEGWLPHLKSGGFMLFHDYFAGVQLAVDELVKDSDKFKDFFI